MSFCLKDLSFCLRSLSLCLALILSACSGIENENADYACRFVFNMNTHANSSALRSAVGGVGVFCRVTTTVKGGGRYYVFENNQGLKDEVIFTAEDQRSTVLLGINGSLILGNGNLDFPAKFYCYDGECPNCFNPDALPRKSHPLAMDDKGVATCNTCRRRYNLNNGGLPIDGEKGTKKLTRYVRASYNPTGVVAVTN